MAQTENTQLTLFVQEFQGDRTEEFEFAQQTKVSEAIDDIVDRFDADALTNPTLFFSDGERLQDNRTLVSYQLDGETVILASNRDGV